MRLPKWPTECWSHANLVFMRAVEEKALYGSVCFRKSFETSCTACGRDFPASVWCKLKLGLLSSRAYSHSYVIVLDFLEFIKTFSLAVLRLGRRKYCLNIGFWNDGKATVTQSTLVSFIYSHENFSTVPSSGLRRPTAVPKKTLWKPHNTTCRHEKKFGSSKL